MRICLRIIIINFVLLSCLSSLACQPDGGDLMPVLQEGTKIVSAQSKADNALQYDNENFSIKVSGTWESLRGEIFCIVVVKNRSGNKITIDFNKAVVANTLNEKIKVMLVSTAYRQKTSETIDSKIAEINAGENTGFRIEYW